MEQYLSTATLDQHQNFQSAHGDTRKVSIDHYNFNSVHV